MKLVRKTRVRSIIPTASMADISFLLIIFFMVSTVFVRYRGVPVALPEVERPEQPDSRRNLASIWIDRQGAISIDDQQVGLDQVGRIVHTRMVANPHTIVSLKGDGSAPFGRVADVLEELRRVEALNVTFAVD